MERSISNNNLLSNISSAIRSSLGVSLAAASLMSDKLVGNSDPEMHKYLAMLKHNQFKLLRLAEKIEDFISDENKILIERQDVDLVLLCSNLLNTVCALTSKLSVTITLRCTQPKLICNVDPIQIERMLLDLISNSLGSTPQGGSIHVSLSASGNLAVLTVSDTGGGIEDNKMEYLFEDHLREKGFTEPRTAGLGMSSVNHIARINSGTVAVTRTSQGTAVSVSLPLSPENTPAADLQLDLYGSGAMQRVITGLADVLSYESYYDI